MLEQETADLKKVLRRQESLRAIIESISSELELRPLLTRIVQYACELLDADRGTIGLVDADQQRVRTEAIYKMPPGELGAEMPRGVGLAGKVLVSQTPILLNQYGELDDSIHPDLAQDTVIGLPIFWHNQMIGFFGIGADPPRQFGTQDVELLSLLARHAAIAITNAHNFDQMQQNLAETQLLYETSRRMTEAIDVNGIIEAYLQHVAVHGQYVCTVALYEFDEFDERTAVIVRGIWSPEEGLQLVNNHSPYTRSGLDAPLDQGRTVRIADVKNDPRSTLELYRLRSETGQSAFAFIPLIVRRQRIGYVMLTHPSVHHWKESDLWPYQVTAVQLAAAIDTRQQQRLLIESSQEVAVLHERQRLARELHDSVTQLIFSMTLVSQSVVPAWQRNPAEGEERVNRLLELSQSALAEMRSLLFELRTSDPPPLPTDSGVTLPGIIRLRRDGLVKALSKHIESLKLERLTFSLNTEQYQPQSLEIEIALFRIMQEALNNVVKHAKATQVKIRLSSDAQQALLQIQDDGLGFELFAQNGRSSHGFGLRTMQERADALNGRLDLQSTPGQGTAVTVQLPLKGETK